MFFKIYCYDIKNGLYKEEKKFVFAILIFLFICFDFYLRFIAIQELTSVSMGTMGDFLFYIFGGMGEFSPGFNEAFNLPALWFLVIIFILYIVLYYPFDDMTGYGKQVLINSHSRPQWWLAKCAWVITCVITYFAIMFITIGAFCIIFRIPLSMGVSNFVYNHYVPGSTNLPSSIIVELLLLPFLTIVTVSLVQLLISLVIKPIFSYCISLLILISSCYYINSFLLGNYAMVRRSILFMENGVSAFTGIVTMCSIIVGTILIGMVVFNKYDILNKE